MVANAICDHCGGPMREKTFREGRREALGRQLNRLCRFGLPRIYGMSEEYFRFWVKMCAGDSFLRTSDGLIILPRPLISDKEAIRVLGESAEFFLDADGVNFSDKVITDSRPYVVSNLTRWGLPDGSTQFSQGLTIHEVIFCTFYDPHANDRVIASISLTSNNRYLCLSPISGRWVVQEIDTSEVEVEKNTGFKRLVLVTADRSPQTKPLFA